MGNIFKSFIRNNNIENILVFLLFKFKILLNIFNFSFIVFFFFKKILFRNHLQL